MSDRNRIYLCLAHMSVKTNKNMRHVSQPTPSREVSELAQ